MKTTTSRVRLLSLACVAGTALLLAACGSNPVARSCGGNNFDEIQLAPGCSAICAQEPCKVYFAMPAGEGDYEVRGRGVSIGRYPAGETVFLGSFWQGSHRLTVEGTDAPPAYLHVGGSDNIGVGD